jgi:YegS/Rv2252/BmrU family lipid kinase
MEKYAVILNPRAGRGKGEKFRTRIESVLQTELKLETIYVTEYPGHARKIAESIKNNTDVIIGVGGDGTIHEIVNGMMGGTAALAVIPMGSGNDFIRMLNLPGEINQAIQVIKENNRKKIDIGKIGDLYFPNGVGLGFDAWVVKESMSVKRLRGFFIYLYSVIRALFAYKNSQITLTMDGNSEERDVFLMAVGNGQAMGGGFFLTPHAIIDDGQLDICLIRGLKKWEVLLHLPKVINGNHIHLEQVQTMRNNKIKIVSDRGIAVHADGELLGMNLKEIDISIIPAALEVIVN